MLPGTNRIGLIACLTTLILSTGQNANAQNRKGTQFVIPAGQEKTVRKMLTLPQALMKAHDCGVKNIKIQPTEITNVFRCGQSTPRPQVLPVVLRHANVEGKKGAGVHRTKKFNVELPPQMHIKMGEVLLEQVRRYEVSFKWKATRKAPKKKRP